MVQTVAAVALAGFLAASAFLGLEVASSAGRNRLVYADRAEEGQSPAVALGIAMGAFRGIFVNFLWIRANSMKEDGKLFESMELARAITTLQPRFPRVWVFHAWNLAYNISVITQTQEERWQWVNAGIRLLRNEGIPANPNDLLIHRELSWIFIHKIQGYTDDANIYYKQRFAEEWQGVLGEPPKLLGGKISREAAIETYAAWLQEINDAPDSLEKLYEREPTARTLVERMRTELGEEPLDRILRRYELLRATERSSRREVIEAGMGERTRKFVAIARDPTLAAAWEAFIPYARRQVLTRDYNMEIPRMIRYTRKFGPMDWRHPASHSLYWAARGVEQALTRWNEYNVRDFDFINADRMTIQAVQELWRTGDLYFDFIGVAGGRNAFFLAVPNMYFADSYGDVMQEMIERSWADNPDQRIWTSYGAGYENFLRDVVRFFYRRGQRDMAEKYLDRLRRTPYQPGSDPNRAYELSDLDRFIEGELKDRQTSPNVAQQEVTASLLDAYARGLVGNDPDAFFASFEYAKRFHRYYMENQHRRTAVADAARMAQLDPDFAFLAGGVFSNFMRMLAAQDAVDDAASAYAAAPIDLRRYAYDAIFESLSEVFKSRAQLGGKTFEQVFPEPPGMAQHRVEAETKVQARTQRGLQMERK